MNSITCNNYIRLSQFYCATTFSDYKNNKNSSALLRNIIRQIEDVNYAIPDGSPVESHKPECVGFTALHFAVLARSDTAVKLLLERGANPTLKSRDGYSPLRFAAENSWMSQRRCLNLQGQLQHPILDLLLSAQVQAGDVTNVSCKNGVSHFHLACMLNHDDAVKFFLDVGRVSVNQVINRDSPVLPGYTALHVAVRYGSCKVVNLLLENGADATLVDAAGMTPLQLLVERNLKIVDVISTGNKYECAKFRDELKVNEQIVILFLNKFRTVHTDLGMPELHATCAQRTTNAKVIKRIIERGEDVNAAIDLRSPVCPGYTTLHIAAHFNIQTVMLLVKLGADVSAKDARGVTPFDICVSHYKPEDLSCIIESVKSLRDICFTDGTKLLDVVQMINDPTLKYVRGQVTSNSPLWTGFTILHLAVEFARRVDYADDVIKKYDHYDRDRLTLKGEIDELSKQVVQECSKLIDVSIQNACGMTALHLAFRQQKRDLVTLLLDEIQRNGMKTNPSDFGNLTHLHIMCVEGRASIIQAYLNSCSDKINLNDAVQAGFQWYTIFSEPGYARPGSTALHLAVIFQKPDIAQLLLQHGADPLVTDADGLTPLQLAFATDRLHESMRDVLLSGLRSRNVNLVSSEGLSHFHIACFLNDLPLVEEFLRQGLADLEAPINCGLKDTHKDRPEAIKTIDYYTSQYDCSENFLPLAPFSGSRALHMAVDGQALETVELLLRHGADTRVRSTAGLSPLQLALRHVHRNQRSRDIVIILIEKQAEYDDITTLHIACLLKDRAAIEKALGAGVEVDAQLAQESPIWPGSTALHLLFEGDLRWDKLEPILELLVRHDANVNQPNFENLTPIHLAYNKNCLPAVKMMLRSSRILESNPVDDEGLSHFHIACALGEDSIVEEFLIRGLANVDKPKDHFLTDDRSGFAPLHFALVYGNCSTVETLLRHGANVLAEDCYKSTVFHKAARDVAFSNGPIYENKVLRCIIANINLNVMDIFGMTPLEICLKNEAGSLIQFLLKHGARANVVNPVTREGLLTNADFDTIKYILENAKDITNIDPDTGFNAIHNIVSNHSVNIDYFDFGDIIESLMEKGCDIDQLDAQGKTPLHVAVNWNGTKTVTILLNFGADINAVDSVGNPPLAYCRCFNRTRAILLFHLDLMSRFGFYVSAANKEHYHELHKRFDSTHDMLDRHRGFERPTSSSDLFTELKEMRNVIIFKGFCLSDLLNETTVAAYPRLDKSKQQAIANIISFRNLYKEMHDRFRNLGCLLRLQHRRALARLRLIEPAKVSLQLCAGQALSDFQVLPDLCSENIIRFLTNEELINLIQISK